MKKTNLKYIFIAVVLIAIISITIFAPRDADSSPVYSVDEQKEQIEKILDERNEYLDDFKQNLADNYNNEYQKNYTKIISGEIEDPGHIGQFERLFPYSRIHAVDTFKEFQCFKENPASNYDFYSTAISIFPSNIECNISLSFVGEKTSFAFTGAKYLYTPTDNMPLVYYTVVVAVEKGEEVNNYKLIAKDTEAVFVPEKIKESGEIKIGDSFIFQLDAEKKAYGAVMDITYMKTDFGSGSPSSRLVYRSVISEVHIMYSVEGDNSKDIMFLNTDGKDTIMTAIKPYITSENKVIGFKIEDLDYKSDIIILPSYNSIALGSYSTNGLLSFCAEAYVNENLWESGPDSVGFEKDTLINFDNFFINLKNFNIA